MFRGGNKTPFPCEVITRGSSLCIRTVTYHPTVSNLQYFVCFGGVWGRYARVTNNIACNLRPSRSRISLDSDPGV